MITQIDFQILDIVREHSAPFFDVFFSLFTKLGDGGVFWVLLTVALLCFKKTRACGVTMAIALLLGLLVGNVALKHIIARPRPFVQDPVLLNYLIIDPPSGYSCPSGHTLAAFECATVIFASNKKLGAAAAVLAVLISFSRIYLGVHFPSDVLFGLALGIGAGALACVIYNKAIRGKVKFKGIEL